MRAARSAWSSFSSCSFSTRCRMGRFIPSVALFDEDGRLTLFRLLAAVAGGGALLRRGGALLRVPGGAAQDGFGANPPALQAASDRRARVVCRFFSWAGSGHKKTQIVLEIVVLYLLVITAILLVLMVTPDRAEYFKGLWRAQKQGPQPPALVGRPVAQPGVPGDRVRASCSSPATVAVAAPGDPSAGTAHRRPSRAATFRWRSRSACWSSRISGWRISISCSTSAGAARPTSPCFCSWRGCCRWWPARSWRCRR